MSYGHAHGLNAHRPSEGRPGGARDAPVPPVEPPGQADARPTAPPWARLYDRADVRATLAERDIGGLFRVLRDDAGLTQRTIAELTGQSQSEVSEILKGRRVLAYDVLVRICEGLGVPRELMGSPTALTALTVERPRQPNSRRMRTCSEGTYSPPDRSPWSGCRYSASC